MQEVFSEAIRPINLPFSVLLVAVACYWLMVAFGALGVDFDGDAHVDIDGDGHIDVHGDHSGDGDAGWFSHLLQFVNIGEVPVTIVGSLLALCVWLFSMLANHYWTGGSLALELAALVPNLLVSSVLVRYLTMPFKPLIRALNREGEAHLPVVGRTCLITTSEASGEFGQAEIPTKGAPLLITVRTRNSEILPRGTTGLVIAEDKAKGLYYIVPVTPDQLS